MCGKTRFGETWKAEQKIINLHTGETFDSFQAENKLCRRESLDDPNSYWHNYFDTKTFFGIKATHFFEGEKWHEVPEGKIIVGLFSLTDGFIPITTQTTPDETLTYRHYRKPLMIPRDFFIKKEKEKKE
jgi:hypothetical protein